MAFWDIPLQNPYRYYNESPSLADVMEELFDTTFPPIRYRFSRYPSLPNQTRQGTPQRQQQLQRAQSQNDDKLQIARLDVSHFKPEEVSCKVENGKVLVTGKHYSENEYGYESSEFHRSYSLPEGVDPLSVKSRISQDGILQIEALKEPPRPLPVDQAVGIDETDDKKMALRFNLAGYKPEEVNVRVKGNELMVTAEHKSEGDGHYTHRHYKRHFSLPNEVDATTLVSRFSKDGTLSVEAEKKPVPAIEEKTIEVQEDEEMKEGDK